MDIKEQVTELLCDVELTRCYLTKDCKAYDNCYQCAAVQIHSLYEQAGYLPIQAGEDGLVENPYKPSPINDFDDTVQMLHDGFNEGSKVQKALDDKEKEDKDEKYNKLADDNFGKVTGDLFRELANPIFRYEFLKETQQINGEILSSKLAIAKKEKEEAVKKAIKSTSDSLVLLFESWYKDNDKPSDMVWNHIMEKIPDILKQTLEEMNK